MVAYPGNPQGRNPRETGPRGCFQVDVDRNGRAHVQFVETNLVRWVHLDFPSSLIRVSIVCWRRSGCRNGCSLDV